jgi:hypothetical protein
MNTNYRGESAKWSKRPPYAPAAIRRWRPYIFVLGKLLLLREMAALSLALSAKETARLNWASLVQVLTMEEGSFSAYEHVHGKELLWMPLKLKKADFIRAGDTNYVSSVSGLRKLVRAFPWVKLTSHEVPERLIDGLLLCTYCHGGGAVAGSFRCSKQGCDGHNSTAKHQTAVERERRMRQQEQTASATAADAAAAAAAAAVPRSGDAAASPAAVASAHAVLQPASAVAGTKRLRQKTLEEADGVATLGELDSALQSRVLAGGLVVARGVPPTLAGGLIDATLLTLLSNLRSGPASPTTLRDTDLPLLVSQVKQYQRTVLSSLGSLAMSTDVGSSGLVDGLRVQAIIVSSSALPHDLTVALHMGYKHETGASVAEAILETLTDLEVDKKALKYLAVDNAAINKKAVKLLVKAGCTDLEMARCLPHCLNLPILVFLEVFEEAFKLLSQLTAIRAYIKAGGGSSRKAMLVESALTLSNMDYVLTRWASAIRAFIYMMAKQTPAEMKKARQRLLLLAAEGDVEAADAADEDDVYKSHWNAIYECIESIPESDRAPVIGSPKKNDILNGLASTSSFGACSLLSSIFTSAPKTISMLQTSSSGDFVGFKPDRLTGELPSAISGVEQLVATFDALVDEKSVREGFLADVSAAIKQQQVDVRASLVADGDQASDAASLAVAADADAANHKATMSLLKKTLKKAAVDVRNSQGRVKLLECIRGLKLRDCFNVAMAPATEPSKMTDFFDFLGVPNAERTTSLFLRLRQQWQAHVAAWKKPMAAVSPQAVQTYWAGLVVAAPELSKLALHHWLRPVSTAPVERIFSILTAMDSSYRQSMGRDTLHHILFLRANRRTVELLAEMQARNLRESARSSDGSEAKRARTAAFSASSKRLAETIVADAAAKSNAAVITA